MTYEPRIGPEGRDDDLTRALRRMYALPDGASYWESLEQRIMARIAADAEWWQPLAGWARVGLLAAAAALLVASIALTRTRAEEARMAFEAVIETPRTPSLQMATEGGTIQREREATLRYVIAP